jgi:hypothetical protein
LYRQKSERWRDALLSAWFPGYEGFAVRSILRQAQGPLELLVLPPEQSFLPLPSFVLGVQGTGQELLDGIKQLVVAVVSSVQKSKATWLRFKRSEEKGRVVHEAFFLGGRLWIVEEKAAFRLCYSSRSDFLKKWGLGSFDCEKGLGTSHADAVLYMDVERGERFFGAWLGRVVPQAYLSWKDSAYRGVSKWRLWTQGHSENWGMRMKADLSASVSSPLHQINNGSLKLPFPAAASFFGRVALPEWDLKQWRQFSFGGRKFLPPEWLLKALGLLDSNVTFAWPSGDPAPLISCRVKSKQSFDQELEKTLPKAVVLGRAGSSDLRTVKWGRNELSYRLGGDRLLFSPLLYPLLDTEGEQVLRELEPSFLSVSYPCSSSLKGRHYTLGALLLQLSSRSKAPMSPNDFPAFRALAVGDEVWTGRAVLRCWRDRDCIGLEWRQPYGPLGLFSGLKLQSSSLIYFLSLCNLTYRSF